MPPTRTSSNLPFSKVRISSGFSKRFKTTSCVAFSIRPLTSSRLFFSRALIAQLVSFPFCKGCMGIARDSFFHQNCSREWLNGSELEPGEQGARPSRVGRESGENSPDRHGRGSILGMFRLHAHPAARDSRFAQHDKGF